jgi:hypothetical protein
MIYIVEIPHQQRPIAWSAFNEFDAVNRMSADAARDGGAPHGGDFDAWVDYTRQDLSSMRVYLSSQEAITGLDEISGHGSGGAADALRDVLVSMGDLPA